MPLEMALQKMPFHCYVYQIFDGENEKIPVPTLDEDDLETIGEIITYAFIGYNLAISNKTF